MSKIDYYNSITGLEELNAIIRSTSEKVINVCSDTTHYYSNNTNSDTLCGKFGICYKRLLPAINEKPVNCKVCLKSMDRLLKQRDKLMQDIIESKIPETCKIVKIIRASDGKIFDMDAFEKAIKYEITLLNKLYAEKGAVEFADSVSHVVKNVEVQTDHPTQGNARLMNLYTLVAHHHSSWTSASRTEMLKALYHFLLENKAGVEDIIHKYKRISSKHRP